MRRRKHFSIFISVALFFILGFILLKYPNCIYQMNKESYDILANPDIAIEKDRLTGVVPAAFVTYERDGKTFERNGWCLPLFYEPDAPVEIAVNKKAPGEILVIVNDERSNLLLILAGASIVCGMVSMIREPKPKDITTLSKNGTENETKTIKEDNHGIIGKQKPEEKPAPEV